MRKHLFVGVSLLLSSSTVYATQFDFGINNDAFNLDFATHIAPETQLFGSYHYDVDDGKIAEIGVTKSHTAGIHTFSIGAKGLNYWAKQNSDVHLLAIGGDYQIKIAPKVALSANAYYSPTVLSSSKLDRYYDYSVKAVYELMPSADVFVGYQDRYFKYENQSNRHYNKGLFIGGSFRF